MDTRKFDIILDTADEDFCRKLMDALGVKPGDTVNFTTPQFTRTDGRIISYFPSSPEEYAALPNLAPDVLKKIGCGVWNKENGKTHWLFPHEWYPHIPAGILVVDINGETEAFEPGKTDDDMRFGCLAYGFLQDAQEISETKETV